MLTQEEIRQYCFRMSIAEGEQFQAALADLLTTLRQHSEKAENRALSLLLKMPGAKARAEKMGKKDRGKT